MSWLYEAVLFANCKKHFHYPFDDQGHHGDNLSNSSKSSKKMYVLLQKISSLLLFHLIFYNAKYKKKSTDTHLRWIHLYIQYVMVTLSDA